MKGPLGSIRADELMPARVMCVRLGWAKKTLWHAKKHGLKIVRFGRFNYCLGADVLEFFRTLPQDGNGSECMAGGASNVSG